MIVVHVGIVHYETLNPMETPEGDTVWKAHS